VTYRNCCHIVPVLLVFSGAAFPQSTYDVKKCDSAPSVPWRQAAGQVVEKAEVEIPLLAKAAHVQGIVRIEVCVSEAGDVVLTKPVGGPPILIPTAVQSAKKWRFKSGQPGPFKTVLEIPFSQGATPAEIAEEAKVNDRFFDEDRKCRDSYHNKKYDDALVLCQGALNLAEKLPKERANERRGAYEIVGHVYFAQQRFEEALQSYKTELQIGLNSLEPYEAELGYAYHDMALAYHMLGRASEAAQNYAKAETTMIQARDNIELEELKPRYSATLKQIREHYLILLRQTGQTAAAADLEKRIQGESK
jgi:tetratricopeptide (TPR) repeat protein